MIPVLEFDDVSFVRSGRPILDRLSWTVTSDQRWVVLGRNGAGKTTLLSLAGASQYPSSGTVRILDEQLGRVALADLKPRIGYAGNAPARWFPDRERVFDLVMSAAWGVTGRWRETYDEMDERRTRRILAEWGLTELADRAYGTLSDGERRKVQIARAVMTDPEMLLLDEPTANLDLGAREELLRLLGGYAASPYAPAMVLVTHHVEEIPVGFTHALVLSGGRIAGTGPIHDVINSEVLSGAFGLPLEVTEQGGRYTARAV